jgi:hypothetical protein
MRFESPLPRRLYLLLVLLPATLLLGGCVAAAIPALASGAILRDRIDGEPDKEAHPERIAIDYKAPPGTPMPRPTPAPTPEPNAAPALAQVSLPAVAAQPQPDPKASEAAPGFAAAKPAELAIERTDPAPELPALRPAAKISEVAEAAAIPAVLPPPQQSPVPAPTLAPALTQDDPYAAFVGYALNLAPPPPPGTARRSAMVDQDSITDKPELSDCGANPPAVLIDLDPGTASFDPADPPLPAPYLAERLAELRRGGLTVLWTASVRVERAQEVWTVLRATGLDPDRTDRLVLPRKAQERKQTRRLAAARDWCIVAIAGDRRADFDELFDYLRDPDGPIAQALAPAMGRGWFLVPTPIE